MSREQQAIGVFDSGVGGTSILKELMEALPNENFVYLSDSINAPYGNKPKEDIIRLSEKNTKLLQEKYRVKLIVVACNTATTNSINFLRKNYKLPFIGIEPAIKPAALQSKTKHIGVLATKGTLSSALFEKTSEGLDKNINLIEVEGKGIVEAVENGTTSSISFYNMLKKQLVSFNHSNIDYMVLGCTHYPYVKPLLQKLLPRVQIIDSGYAVAQQTKRILEQQCLVRLDKNLSRNIEIYSNKQNLKVIKNLFKNEEARYTIEYLDF